MPHSILTRLTTRALLVFGMFAFILGPLYVLPYIGLAWTGVYFLMLFFIVFLGTFRAAIPV